MSLLTLQKQTIPLITNKQEIANNFNACFSNIGNSIISSLNSHNRHPNSSNFQEIHNANSMYVEETNDTEIGECIDEFKVTPILKSGSKTWLENFRPITIVSIFSKLIEMVIKNRILNFSERNGMFDKYQYGFQKKSNTQSTTIDFLNHVTTSLDKQKYVITLSVDLQKAFDVVDHRILLKKLELIGIRENMLSLIQIYLYNREQCLH